MCLYISILFYKINFLKNRESKKLLKKLKHLSQIGGFVKQKKFFFQSVLEFEGEEEFSSLGEATIFPFSFPFNELQKRESPGCCC